MIGKIKDIDKNHIKIVLSEEAFKYNDLLHFFVLFKDEKCEYIGEFIKLEEGEALVNLLGEIDNGKFVYGFSRIPSFSSCVYLVSKKFNPNIVGGLEGEKYLNLGISPTYGEKINVNIDSFFGSHFAIFGSTGSGKSCSFARIIQNLFNENKPKNSNIIIFDAYGEYKKAFSPFNKQFKTITTDIASKEELLKIPLWLLDSDDVALLLNASSSFQLLLIDKALRILNIFKRSGEEAEKYKNSIIANNLLEILESGRSSVQIRDQVLALLSKYNTLELNAETKIMEPGYTRTLKQCLYIDASGKINSIELVEKALENFVLPSIPLTPPDGSYPYTLEDLLSALDFALIDEGVWKSEEVYDKANFLKVRLENLISSDYSYYFKLDYINKEDFIKSIFDNKGEKAGLVNFNINYLDDRFAKTVTKIYSKLLFNYAKDKTVRGEVPFNIILEEAHRYVQNDKDVEIIGYNIFERICKEGRKYGVLMGFISQRPSELSETCISQCNNYLIFKMTHSADLNFIKSIVPYITEETYERVKSLSPGTGIGVGKSFNMPIVIKFSLPNPTPSSENAEIYKAWFN